MPSSRHKLLKQRVTALKRNLLPKRASLTGNYTDRELDRIAGYFVLVHAEIESYIEDRSERLLDLAHARWKTTRKICRPLFCVMTYYAGERKGPPASFDINQFKDRNLDTLIGASIAQHRARIISNNGIKENNISELLFPLGFTYADLSSTLVASLDSFGSRRGNFAHLTIAKALTQHQIDPFVEAKTVDEIINELSKTDPSFEQLHSQI